MDRALLIASVFGPSAHNELWYRLQRRFIAENTDVAYDYRVFLNGVDPGGFDPAHIAHASAGNMGHSHALGKVLEAFRGDRHATYLVLDSDCFPILRGWHDVLTGTMKRFGKTLAAPFRCENLDVFPHPCACFLLDEALDDDRLTFDEQPATNLLGAEICDVGTGLRHMQDAVLPLLRTNVVNVHPVAAAIYHGMFYHHGAGSRGFTFRVSKRYAYNDHWWPPSRDLELGRSLLARLRRNPEAFLDCLRGDLAACGAVEGEEPAG